MHGNAFLNVTGRDKCVDIRIVTIYDLEELHELVEEVIIQMRISPYCYDEDGSYIALTFSDADREAVITTWLEGRKTNYLCFRENEELHKISFSEALDMSLETIKEKYLRTHLKKMRCILRKGLAELSMAVSDDVPDAYLDDLLALRWKENLKLWTIQWDQKKSEQSSKAD